jgi:hypothetical protein
MYEDVISWYIINTDFDIYIVDSYNNRFNDTIESTCKVCHFDQTTFYTGTTSALEILSLQEAWKMFSDDWTNYNYIVKLTGKYIHVRHYKMC